MGYYHFIMYIEYTKGKSVERQRRKAKDLKSKDHDSPVAVYTDFTVYRIRIGGFFISCVEYVEGRM